MTQPLAPLDAHELTAWLTRLTQTVDRSLRDPQRSEVARALRDGLDAHDKNRMAVLIQLAFLSDCLHVANLAILADGRVDPGEIARIADLVRVASSKYCFALPAYEAFGETLGEPAGDPAAGATEIARFLAVYRDDAGPFGLRWTEEWRGLRLARLVERQARNAAPLQDHERMLVRIMDTVFDGRTTSAERVARRRLRDLFEQPGGDAPAVDPRQAAFCRSDGPEIFASVAHGAHVHERDPFDVEMIHAEARAAFHQHVERATTPEQAQRGQGRMLLVLGESGAGKTHLLRALRAQVHGGRLGYVGYLQLSSDVDDYARLAVRGLVDSLEHPYDAPSLTESALMYLSDGLAEGRDAISPDDLERLRTAELAPPELEQLIGELVSRVVRSDGLERLETDLIQALLLLQRRDPALQRRVVRFLRCETLTNYDRQLLGGLASRDKAEDPLRTIRDLALIMHELQLAALVLMIDQIEEAVPDGHNVVRLQQALDSMRAISDGVPSAVVVLACLSDVYDAVRPKLLNTLTDRLESNQVRLISARQPDEIEQMLIRRLEHLYGFYDVAWRDDDPLYPFTPAQIAAVSQLRTRDCLGRFRAFHGACIAAHAIVAPMVGAGSQGREPVGQPAFDKLWRDALEQVGAPPEDDASILALVADAIRGAAIERGLEVTVRTAQSGDMPSLIVEGKGVARRVAAICNGAPQRGRFGTQLSALRAAATRASAMPIALRNGEVKFQPKSKMAQHSGELLAAGGLVVALAESQLRTAAAARRLSEQAPEGFAAWRKANPQLSELAFVRKLLDLDRETPSAGAGNAGTGAGDAGTGAGDAGTGAGNVGVGGSNVGSGAGDAGLGRSNVGAGGIGVSGSGRSNVGTGAGNVGVGGSNAGVGGSNADVGSSNAGVGGSNAGVGSNGGTGAWTPLPDAVRLGVVDSFRADPILLPLEDIKTHVAFLGSTGSGKTTAALSVVEQLLERGVSVVMVDRKGDLARYVSDLWWNDPAAPDAARERKRALRARIELALFTPGNSQGRPLRIPLVPVLSDVKRQDREQLARYAAESLGAMMGYGKTAAHKAKASVLQCAINLHGDDRDITLQRLLETISRPDPELLHSVGALQRHFASLTEDLDTLRIQRGWLLSGDGEPLDIEMLLPPVGRGRPRLTIINTSALTEVPVLQFWISRLLVELSRLGRKRPSPTLQAAAFFDEADTYVPATSAPPTKEPMFDLLRRSRSTGIGVLLATQNPGDFDYKARDNINTWLLGKIAQDYAIGKMKNLIGNYPDVGPRLASQRTGSFFLLTGTTKRELKADRSLMETVQLPESEVAELARGTRVTAQAAPGSAG